MQTILSSADPLAADLARFDTAELARRYSAQGDFLVVEGFLGGAVLAPMLAELEAMRGEVHRKWVPGYKSGGSVSAFALAERAPSITALYRSEAMRAFVAAVVGAEAMTCPAEDPHAYALYVYTEPGDHVGFHLDKSWYHGKRYTVLLGLVNRSESRLICQTNRDGVMCEDQVATEPGTLVLFDGDAVRHALSPLGEDQVRAALTLQYVTSRRMGRASRFVSNLKDAITYFGFGSWRRKRRPMTPGT